MKIVITGYTQGIGEILYKHWKALGHDVIGLSRASGYDFNNGIDSVVDALKDVDLFVNNANINNSQIDLFKKSLNAVPATIVIGSGLHNYIEYGTFPYIEEKKKLFNLIKTSVGNSEIKTKILHVGLTFVPDEFVDDDNFISWENIISVIDYWLANPVFWDVNYNWKATEVICNKLRKLIPDLNIDFS